MKDETHMVSKRLFLVTLAVAVCMTITAGISTSRYLALRQAVTEREEAVPGSLPRYSLLHTPCEEQLANRLKSWVLGIDVCDPWL